MSFSPELLANCWFLAGPTASGKTAVSLELADQINAEIIALDSMTLYRGMDIGTAKPSAAERSTVPHHMIDTLNPHDEFSLADYVEAVEKICHGIVGRGRVPLFVGGAGLYLRGLLRGVFEGPAADWNLRRQLEEVAAHSGAQSLWDRLHMVDAATAQRLHPNDQRRIIRALEVYELTGQPLSKLHMQGVRPKEEQPQHVYWLSGPRDWLHQRIDERVERMFEAGLVGEVWRLIRQPRGLSHTARQALGYKEVIDRLESNRGLNDVSSSNPLEISASATAEVINTIQTRTRQFAKRQETWFRNLEECQAIPLTGHESPQQIAAAIVSKSSARCDGDRAPNSYD